VLPYASYLRVYEPAETLTDVPPGPIPSDGTERVAVTVATEQQVALAAAVHGPLSVVDHSGLSGAYVLTRDGRDYLCPVDLPLRSWLAMSSLVEEFGDVAVRLLMPAATRALADEAFVRWRREHPAAVAHIRQETWGVPRTWFLLVVEDEREAYDAGGQPGIRYRARINDARRRLGRAQSTLTAVIEDVDLHEELADLSSWLDTFDEDAWVEVDYAGVAQLLGTAAAQDQSARDVHRALQALRRGDYAAAGTAYRRFEERWRGVNAYERSN
jgi:hypothetical protein